MRITFLRIPDYEPDNLIFSPQETNAPFSKYLGQSLPTIIEKIPILFISPNLILQ